MSNDRKTTVWPWIAALIVLLVLYIASFGPACWITSRVTPVFVNRATYEKHSRLVGTLYWPLLRMAWAGGEATWEPVASYSRLYAVGGWTIAYSDGSFAFDYCNAQ